MQDGDELLLITQQGMILRMADQATSATIGRATQGVRLIDIEGDDKVVSIARLVEKDDETCADGEAAAETPTCRRAPNPTPNRE